MPIDYLNDENGDLAAANGDLVKGDATKKHQFDLLMTAPGQCREFPTVGVDLLKYINDDDPAELVKKTMQEFRKDGMTVTDIQFDEDGKLITDCKYNE